jgi:hypothetical protein
MSFYRWKEFKHFALAINKDESKTESDPWYEFSAAVDEFNSIRCSKRVGSQLISVDETMCVLEAHKNCTWGAPKYLIYYTSARAITWVHLTKVVI